MPKRHVTAGATAATAVLVLAILLQAALQPHYLAVNSIDVKAVLPDPPTAGSTEVADEIALVLRLQENRTQAAIERCLAEDKFSVFAFSTELGSWFTPQNCPQTAALFKRIESDAKVFGRAAKEHWQRPRPPLTDPRIKPIVPMDKESSYPSSHATRGVLYAEILAQLFPEKRAALVAHGQSIGWDRVIAGVHHPSDIFGGRTLGHALAGHMLAASDFQIDLAAVKQELEHAANALRAPEPAHAN
jgi:acid phosphatase (class A)